MTRVIWKSNKKDHQMGYLRLSTRVGSKTKIKSLGLEPISKRYFNPKEGRVRKSHPRSEELNKVIEKKLKEVQIKGNSLQYINDESKSFLFFFKTIIDRTINHGTKTKYVNIYTLLNRFNESKFGGLDIKFKDITPDFIHNFQKWMIETNKNTLNTSNYKLKTFQSIVNKSIEEGVYNYHTHPFKYIKYKFNESKVDILSKTDLEKLINTNLVEVYRGNKRFGEIITDEKILNDPRYKHNFSLEDVRSYFLFQLFCQGIRVSDLITLRWNNFYLINEELRFRKRMIKTRHEIDIIVNDFCLDILVNQLIRKGLFNEKLKPLSIINSRIKDYNEPVDDDTLYNYEISLFDHDYKFNLLKLGFEEFIHPENSETVGIIVSKRELEDRLKGIDSDFGKSDKKYSDFYDKNEFIIDEGKKNKGPYEEKNFIPEDKVNDEWYILNKIWKNIIRQEKWETQERKERLNELLREKRKLINECILILSKSKEEKNSFCFPLINDKDFTDIDDRNNFSSMTKLQYSKFQSGRVYYNRLLKVVSSQCDLSLNLTSHISRHSYTSLMLEIGENINLFDVMTSLGHKHLDTTQKYLQRFNHEKIDILNKQLSDYLTKK